MNALHAKSIVSPSEMVETPHLVGGERGRVMLPHERSSRSGFMGAQSHAKHSS
jgi:hypothetical protein